MEREYKLREEFSEALSGLDFVLPEITIDFKKDIVMPYYNAPFGREENGIFETCAPHSRDFSHELGAPSCG